MSNEGDNLNVLDRATRSFGVQLTRRSLFKGGVFGLASLAGLKILAPIDAAACSGCHYCVSGCTNCGDGWCCSYGTGDCLHCYSNCGINSYIKNYVCDNYCDYWCATGPC